MGLEISISKKGLMKAGVISSIIFALVFLGFFVVNFILPVSAGFSPGTPTNRPVYINITTSDANQTDDFFTCGNVIWIRANVSCTAEQVCNETVTATANFTSIGGDPVRQGLNISGVEGLDGWRLFEFNDTVDCGSGAGQITITNFQVANISVNVSNTSSPTVSTEIAWTTPLLVNMSTVPGCPPAGENIQIPPQVRLLNGTIVTTTRQCLTNCGVDDVAQFNNTNATGTFYNLCGPTFSSSSVNLTQIAYNGNFSSVPLVLDIAGKVKINFTTPVNMSDQYKSSAIMQFAMKSMMSGGRVGVNETEWSGGGGKPDLRVAARLTIYNASARLGIPSNSKPSIGYRSNYGSGDFGACPPSVCSGISWDGENLTFTVSSFSEYTIERGLAVTLNGTDTMYNPARNVSFSKVRNINFTFTPKWNATTNITNATLFANFSGGSGNFSANAWNTTPLQNNTLNGINFTVNSTELTYIWNIVLYDNNDASDTNEANHTVVYDATTPVFNVTTPANNGYISGNDTQLFQVYVYDPNLNTSNTTLHYKLSTAGTPGTWTSGTGLTCYAQTSPLYICNTTINDLYDTFGDSASFKFYFQGSDNATNYGSNGTASSPLTTTIDRTAPTNTSTSIEKVASGTKYDTTGLVNYGFQMSWTDSASGMSKVIFESNFTGGGATLANTTASNTSSAYYVNFTMSNFLQAGTYAYKWYANDSITPINYTNWAVSDTFYYTITTADNPVDLYLNNTKNANVLDLRYPNTVNATVVVTAGTMQLYRNVSGTWTEVGAAPYSENRTYVSLPVGTHAYTVNSTGNANYSANNSAPSYYIIVNQGVPTVTLSLNGSSSNLTVASGAIVNITALASNAQGVVWIFNGTGIANQTGTSTLALGNATLSNITTWSGSSGTQWNITGYYNGSQNYSASNPAGTCTNCNFYIKIESTPPTYTDNYTDVTASIWGKYQGSMGVNAKWNDGFNLSRVWVYSNTTGVWGNTYGLFGANNVSNFSIDPSAVTVSGSNVVIQAIIYANDTSNNTNNTNTFSWTIDGVAPVLSSPSPSNNTYIYLNNSYPFRVTATDNTLNVSNATVYWKTVAAPSYSSSKMTCTGTAPTFTCLNSTIDLSIYGEGNIIYFYFEATDNSSLMNRSANSTNPWVVTLDVSAPKYSNNGTNATVIGRYDGIKIYANWTDADTLDTYILELSDGTDTWNYTQAAFSTGTWSNISLSNSSWTKGTTITWKIYANDTVPNWNVTTPVTFTIDNTKPIPIAWNANTTNGTVIAKGTQIAISANWTDNIGLIFNETIKGKWWVWYNESNTTGANRSYTAFTANNLTNSSITIDTSSFTKGIVFTAKFYANDTSNNENVTEVWQWTIDNIAPTYSANGTNITSGDTIVKGTPILVYANWNDNLNLSQGWIQHNETGTMTNTSILFTGAGNSTNYTITTSSVTAGATFHARLFANDTSGNENFTAPTWSWTIDGTAPTSANVTRNSASANGTATYAPGITNTFNVSWTDNLGTNNVSTGVFLNFSYSATNYTATSIGNSNWTVTVTDLPVGNYWYRWYANDTSNNWGETSNYSFNVTQNTSTASFVGLALNGTEGNVSYYYPQAINATAWKNITETGNLSLWRDGAIVASTLTGSSVSQQIVLGNNTYNYSLSFTPTNYTSVSVSADRFALVNKGATNITLWMGQSGSVAQGNATLPQGSTLNITATINTSYNVWLNITTNLATGWVNQSTQNTRIENTTSTSTFGLATDYNITASFNGDGNYTATSRTYWLNITGDVTGPTVKLWDDTSGSYYFNNTTAVKTGTRININASISDAGVGVGTSNYVCNITLVLSGTDFNVDTITYSGTASSGWCNKTVAIPASLTSGYYTLNVSINDTNNNKGGNNSFTLTVDNTAPIITVSTPANASYNKMIGRVWINGTVSDNLQMGIANISVNNSNFAVYNFTGANATTFAIWNTSAISDGYLAIRINYTDNATNVGNVTVYFYEDNSIPTTVAGLTNSSSQNYAASSSQAVQILIVDGVQTNESITFNYNINDTWYSSVLTGTPSTSTTYTATISTLGSTYRTDSNGRSYVPYYITGVDNATNNITNGGSTSSPLANLTLGTTGTIQGYVKQNGTTTVINGAIVSDGTRTTTSNSDGFYQITSVPADTYTLSVSATNYITNSSAATVTVTAGATTTANVTIASNGTGIIQGYVFLTNRTIVPNSTSSLKVSDGTRTVSVNTAGFYQITSVPAGTYTVTVSGSGYRTNTTSATLTVGGTTQANISVTGAENFNVTIPGSSTASATVGTNGFLDSGWHTAVLQTGILSAATTNYTIERLFSSIGVTGNYNYSSIWRYNSTGGWSSFIPGQTNTLINITSVPELYYIHANATDRVEIEPRYT